MALPRRCSTASPGQVQTALQIDPLYPLLNISLGLRYWGRGDYAGARDHFLRVLELPRPTVEPYVRLIELNRDFGRLGEALRWAKEAVLRHPGFTTLQQLVHTFGQLELDDDVARWMERVLSLEGDGPPRLGLHSEMLFYRGDFEGIYRMKMEYVQRAGRPLSELPFVIRETHGGMMVMTGRYEDGIGVLEPLFGENFRIPQHLGGSRFALTFAQLLAYAYQMVGRHEDKAALLRRIQGHIATLRAAGSGHSPGLYIVEARNFALLGESREALQTLRLAVNAGWRDPAFERHIPAWDALRGDAEYQALIALVEADVAAQCSLVEAQGRDVAFETAALAALGLPAAAEPRRVRPLRCRGNAVGFGRQVKVHGSTSKQPETESAQVRLDRPAVLLVNDAALHDEIDVLQQVDVFEHVTTHGNDIRFLAR